MGYSTHLSIEKLMQTTGRFLILIFCFVAEVALASQKIPAPSSTQVLISVADQKLVLLNDGDLVTKYPISTSRFGVGDSFYSYKTPVGKLRVCEKIGSSLDPGTVIKKRTPTSEVIPVNAPGRDPIVTRILWLEGLEGQNHNAKARCIYIHGTPEERTIGLPKSWGCIRMRSSDVVTLFGNVPVGTEVTIIPGHLPHLDKYRPPVDLASKSDPATLSSLQKILKAMKGSILNEEVPAVAPTPSHRVAVQNNSPEKASAKQ